MQYFYEYMTKFIELSQPIKGAIMAKVIEKAETLFEKFERSLEALAEKIL